MMKRNVGYGDVPGSPVVKNPYFQGREHRFDPWSGDRSHMPHGVVKKKIGEGMGL